MHFRDPWALGPNTGWILFVRLRNQRTAGGMFEPEARSTSETTELYIIARDTPGSHREIINSSSSQLLVRWSSPGLSQ
ncbi:hypothetical protein RRG08_009783 [Elysia crispata]|uniref:Uncharacterized protein n=1 Tax=Elysia crispata TaxID=231223 RepID=A0AAE1DKD0_9GAST|nr:hypothetical protein RRG08_009783 [Elysia crispata]